MAKQDAEKDNARDARLTVYLSPDKRKALHMRALEGGTKATRLVERLIDEYLARPARKGGSHGR